MTNRQPAKPRWKIKLCLSAAIIASLLPETGFAGRETFHAGAEQQDETTQSFSFDAVSVRQNTSGKGFGLKYTPDGFTSANMPLQLVIVNAYNLRDPELIMGQKPIPGAPRWIQSDTYDIQAKVSPTDFATMQKLTEEQRVNRIKLMMQSMLADRFHLKVRKDIQSEHCYALVVDKNGPKFKESSKIPASPDGEMAARPGNVKGEAIAISGLIFALTAPLGCQPQDKTGLTGRYNLALQYAVDPNLGAYRMRPDSDAQDAPKISYDASDPSLFTAIRTQLGLKLIPATLPKEGIVIEHIERPSAN